MATVQQGPDSAKVPSSSFSRRPTLFVSPSASSTPARDTTPKPTTRPPPNPLLGNRPLRSRGRGVANGSISVPRRWNSKNRNGCQGGRQCCPSRATLAVGLIPVRYSMDSTAGSSASGLSPLRAVYSLTMLKPSTTVPNKSAVTPSRVSRLRTRAEAEVPSRGSQTCGLPAARWPRHEATAWSMSPSAIIGSSSAYTCQPIKSAMQVFATSCRKRPFWA